MRTAALAFALLAACATSAPVSQGKASQAGQRGEVTPPSVEIKRPAITLPEVSPKVRQGLGLPPTGEVPGSVRSWQYKPGLTDAVQQLGTAITQDLLLPKDLALRVVVVVAARVGCFY